jgi:thiol-disulfide isomerase/thioredoxin
MSGRRATRQPETIALVFHAGWCPACKVLGPNLQQVRPDFDDKAILWVTLDQTDRASRQAEYLAAALGAESVWQDYRGKTGFVVLIDAKTKTVVGKITSDSTPEEIRETLAFVKG